MTAADLWLDAESLAHAQAAFTDAPARDGRTGGPRADERLDAVTSRR